jgi:hypothetical protein
MTNNRKIALSVAVAVAVVGGVMLPWITITSGIFTVSVAGSAGDGWIIAVCALLSLITLYSQESWKFGLLAAVAASGVSFWKVVQFADLATSYQDDGAVVSFGPGLGLALLGSVVACGVIATSREGKETIELPNSDK